MVSPRSIAAMLALLTASCGGDTPARPSVRPNAPSSAEPGGPATPRVVTLSLVGTNDLHGHLERLPVLAGYLANLRAARAEDGGGVVLVDGGDMFQGTLESNLLEGAPIVSAYDALGYDAVTIGNHEFDYGPVGERATPGNPGDDPRGALLARVAQAGYPFLSANLRVAATGASIEWPGVTPSATFERAGVRVAVIGVTTEATLGTTMEANVADLAMAPLAASIAAEASRLREGGADVVIVAAHAGGRCESFDDPHDTTSCEHGQEIFEVAEALPEGAVDAIVAGHTHAAVGHFVSGVPVIESYSYGRAFGRIDLRVDLGAHRVLEANVHAPRDLCRAREGECEPEDYEGRPVVADASIAALLAPAVENAREARSRPLGVTLSAPVRRDYDAESALGNLFTDLMLAARPGSDVALTNGGGLRADLPAGALTYGQLYEASPFDNRFAIVSLSAAELEAILANNLGRSGGIFSIAGLTAQARCRGGSLEVELRRPGARAPLPDETPLRVVTTDFLATGGDGAFGAQTRREGAITIEDGQPVRDAMAAALTARGGTVDPAALLPARPARRLRYEGSRPVRCQRE